MAKAKQYAIHCPEHHDTFNQGKPLTYKEAKELVAHATKLSKAFGGRGCKLQIVEYKAPRLNFAQALHEVIHGPTLSVKIARDGWNGKGLFVAAQFPDEHSKMGNPYLYIDASALGGKANPWVPSQTDLFADDWYIVEIE